VNLTTQAITVAGVQRSFLLAAPANTASAVVLSLHGTRSSAEDQVRLSRMAQLAETAGAVVAFPQAVMPIGSGYEWDHDGDMPFLLELVADLRTRYPTPSGRVCVAGMSGGARMACHVAATHPEVVAAVGAVAGIRAPDGPALSRPVPIVAFHGTADRINPYDGSGTARWNESVGESARRWALSNGVAAEPATVVVSPSLTRTTYGGEGQPGEVTLWTSRGAGHTWPGSRLGLFLRLFLGRTTTEIDATAQIWSFAQRHWTEA
jgi:polyhydroxybutyrate depolymerase